jgi:hypothetical protein
MGHHVVCLLLVAQANIYTLHDVRKLAKAKSLPNIQTHMMTENKVKYKVIPVCERYSGTKF